MDLGRGGSLALSEGIWKDSNSSLVSLVRNGPRPWRELLASQGLVARAEESLDRVT